MLKRCLSCEQFSINIICKSCQQKYLKPILLKREIDKDFFIFSFYKLDEIKDLVKSKYYDFGDLVYDILAKNSFYYFAKHFKYDEIIYSLNLEDNIKDFSQSAILNRYLKSNYIKPIFSKIVAQNKIKYAGKSLEYRKKHKRGFKYFGKPNLVTILVDDVVTTGETMKEAKRVLEDNNCKVLFGITLADAKN